MIAIHYQVNGRKTGRRVASSFLHLSRCFRGVPAPEMGRRSPRYIERRTKEGAKPATIRQELANLNTALGLAVQAGLLDHRPPIAHIAVRNVRTFAITEERCDALLAYLPSDIRDVAEFAYLTGWRRGEILSLLWSNVDRVNKIIRLEPGTTKNGCGRVFPYGAFPLLDTLLRRRERKTVEAEAKLGLIIPLVFHRGGEPIRSFYKSWRCACERAGIRGYVLHDLRRSTAQNLLRSGTPIQTAMALLGHRTRSMFDRYAIVDEEDLRMGIERYAQRMALSKARLGP